MFAPRWPPSIFLFVSPSLFFVINLSDVVSCLCSTSCVLLFFFCFYIFIVCVFVKSRNVCFSHFIMMMVCCVLRFVFVVGFVFYLLCVFLLMIMFVFDISCVFLIVDYV